MCCSFRYAWALLGTVALAQHGDHVGTVEKTVEQAFGDDSVGEERVEVLGLAVRGEDEGASAVAAANQLVEVLCLQGRVLAQGEVVEDEQFRVEVATQTLVPAAIGTAAGQVGEESAGLAE